MPFAVGTEETPAPLGLTFVAEEEVVVEVVVAVEYRVMEGPEEVLSLAGTGGPPLLLYLAPP